MAMGMNEKKQIHALNALKILAIALVFNSHCTDLYPASWMATGGALGNSLFFILSGYLLKIDDAPFWPWIGKRVLQLYPGMLIASAVNLITKASVPPTSLLECVHRYIWPTGYWFVGGLLLFNVVIYILNKLRVFNRFGIYSAAMLALYVLWYLCFVDKTVWSIEEHGFFRLIYYFYIYSLGYCLRQGSVRIDIKDRWLALGAATGFFGNIAWKLVMARIPRLMATQFLCQLFCLLFAGAILEYALRHEDGYCRRTPPGVVRALDFWSKYSLEIYFAQRVPQRLFRHLAFPLNLLVAVVLTLPYAWLLKQVTSFLTGRIGGRGKRAKAA